MKLGLPWFLLSFCVLAIRAEKSDLEAVIESNNAFSGKLYDVLRRSVKENFVVSPLSVSTVMAMLQTGARGETSQSIQSVLNFPSELQLHPGYKSLLKETFHRSSKTTLKFANKLFPADEYELNPDFTNTLKTYYDADPVQLNFQKNVDACSVINGFVQNVTENKIREILKPDDLDSNTKLVLINAIYFKSQWQIPFPKNNTENTKFFINATNHEEIPMMRLDSGLLYGFIPELDATAVSIPYKGGKYAMLIIVPKQLDGLQELQDKLKTFQLNQIYSRLKISGVVLYLPKFKIESEFNLAPPLTQLGLGDIFNSLKANFTGIGADPTSRRLFVSKAIQKAFLEVDEDGSEASAASVVTLHNRNGPKTVTADRPFYGVIYGPTDEYTKPTTLFQFNFANPESAK